VIYFIGPDIIDKVSKLGAIGEVSVMKKEFCPWLMRVNVDMVYTGGTEGARPSDDSMDLVALIQK
jgi:hypothetical protein